MVYPDSKLIDPRYRFLYLLGSLMSGIFSVLSYLGSRTQIESTGTLESIMALLTGPFGALAGMLLTLYVCVKVISRLYEQNTKLQQQSHVDKDHLIEALQKENKDLKDKLERKWSER